MVLALFAALFFSWSALLGRRAVGALGGADAFLGRTLLATVFLGVVAHVAGAGFGGPARWLFVLSGVIGFGLGDLALFAALPRIGPRLALLMTQCLAAPIAGVCEWLWLGTRPSGAQILLGLVVLAGVGLALAPDGPTGGPTGRLRLTGLLCGLLSATGQALGAVSSRWANGVNAAAGVHLSGLDAAYERILGGLAVAALYWGAVEFARRRRERGEAGWRARWRAGWGWSVANALAGPVLGVSCYQGALAVTSSAVVLPVVAMSPLLIVPFAWWFDGDRPSARSLCGGAVAVGAVIGLLLV